MTPEQLLWMRQVGGDTLSLLQTVEDNGTVTASTTLGEHVLNSRRVRLTLVAEVADPGVNPLQSHASVNNPTPPPESLSYPKPEPQGWHRPPRRPKRR
ncbi:MAG: hypothetical protein ACJAY2_002225 [Pseudomonadales bacterium]|jgi:hypothetical protein